MAEPREMKRWACGYSARARSSTARFSAPTTSGRVFSSSGIVRAQISYRPTRRVYGLVALLRRLLVALLRRLLGTDCLREVKLRETDGTPRADERLY